MKYLNSVRSLKNVVVGFRDKRVSPYIVAVLAAFLFATQFASAQLWNVNEYNLLQTMNPTVLSNNFLGGLPDADGMVGSNQHGIPGTGSFSADEQRGVIDYMGVGLGLLRGTTSSPTCGTYAVSQCDKWVADAVLAITQTYALQVLSGSQTGTFYTTVTENSGGTVTGSSPAPGPYGMPFFLAWSNHALALLRQACSPSNPNQHWATIYGTNASNLLTPALLAKIQSAMDFFYAPNGGAVLLHNYTGPYHLETDLTTPNRTMINATAFAFGWSLLNGIAPSSNLVNYRTEGLWWLDNEFQGCASYTDLNNYQYRPLFDPASGVFREGNANHFGNFANNDAGSGYDTSYQGVAAQFFYYYLTVFPRDIPLPNNPLNTTTPTMADPTTVLAYVQSSGHWLVTRILSHNSPSVDDSLSTRTGPTGGQNENKVTDYGDGSARWSLMYYDALMTAATGTAQTEGTNAALTLGPHTPHPILYGNPVMAPEITSSPSTLVVAPGESITPAGVYQVFATNAAIINSSGPPNYQSADPLAAISMTGSLPAGLSFGSIQTFNNPGSLDSTNGTPDQSLAWADITGKVSTSAAVHDYSVSFTGTNTVTTYTYAGSGCPGASCPPPAITQNGTQTGSAMSLTIRVTNKATLSPSDDAYVYQAQPTYNYGTASQLILSDHGATANRYAFLRFDTSSVPSTATIYKATLQLYGQYSSSGTENFDDVQCFGVPDNDTSPTWVNGDQNGAAEPIGHFGIAWDNMPPIDSQNQSITTVRQGSVANYPWDVTRWVNARRAIGNNKLSLMVSPLIQVTQNGYFNSSRNTNPPVLVIYYR